MVVICRVWVLFPPMRLCLSTWCLEGETVTVSTSPQTSLLSKDRCTYTIRCLESIGYSYITALNQSARHEWFKVDILIIILPLFLPRRPQFRVYCSRYRAVIRAICCKRRRGPVSVISATVSLSSVILLTDTFMPG